MALVVAADAPWSVDLEIRVYRQQDAIGRAAEAFWEAAASVVKNTTA